MGVSRVCASLQTWWQYSCILSQLCYELIVESFIFCFSATIVLMVTAFIYFSITRRQWRKSLN